MRIVIHDGFVTYAFNVNESNRSVHAIYGLILESLYPLELVEGEIKSVKGEDDAIPF